VIAEGVEAAHQLQALRVLRCELAQGFYFHGPLPARAISELLLAEAAGGGLSAGTRTQLGLPSEFE